MADPFDLDALIAEEQGEPFTFVFDGTTYEMPFNMDVRALAQASAGDLQGAFVRMLGAEQWQRILDAESVLSASALMALFTAYANHSGMDLPNLLGSTGLSQSTAGRSKPISNGRTTPRSRASSRAR